MVKQTGAPHRERDLADDWLEVVEDRLRPLREVEKRKGDQERKTEDEVFDQSTLLTLYKMISSGLFETVDFPISTGKEANVFHATVRNGDSLAVKIFRVNTATFRSFMTYIHGDPRFQSVRHNRRDIVYTWCQKEFKNLQRMREAGVSVPTPITYQNNVLVMEFIGEGGLPAPRLRDKPPADPAAAFESIKKDMKLAFQGARLVHGDLSEYNVLNLDEELYVIDVAQSVLSRHPMAKELLERDIRNVGHYFKRFGIPVDAEKLRAEIAPPPPTDDDEDDDADPRDAKK